MKLGGSRDRNNERLLGEQPRESNLRPCSLLLLCNLPEHIHQLLIGLASLRIEARHSITEVAAGEGCVLVDGAGEKSLAKRAERDKGDPELLERRQDFLFRRSPPKRILALEGGDGLNRVCAADRLSGRLRQAEVLHFACLN